MSDEIEPTIPPQGSPPAPLAAPGASLPQTPAAPVAGERSTDPLGPTRAEGEQPIDPFDPTRASGRDPDAPHAPDVQNGDPDPYVQPPRPPIVQWVPKKRVKRSDPPLKRGKPSWVWGTKLEFFGGRKDLWLKAMEEGSQSVFYTKMAKLYVLKYGRELADKEDFEFDVMDPPDELANRVVNEVLSTEETASHQKYYAWLRDRIGAWYRTQYANLVKDDKVVFGDLFGSLTAGVRKKPKKPKLQHYYSSRFYHERVAGRVEARLRALEKRAGHTGEAMPEAITVQNEMTKEVLEEEPEHFVAQLELDLDREYKRALKGWQDSLADSPPRTPEEFSTSLKTAAHYLEPFVTVIGERFGMVASLLLCGPVGSRGGRIEMRRSGSVHSGTTKGLVESDWPRHDPAGFRAVESSMVAFAHNVFTRADCDARITAEQDVDIPMSIPAAAPSATPPAAVPSAALPSPAAASSAPMTVIASAAAGAASAGTGAGAAASTGEGGVTAPPADAEERAGAGAGDGDGDGDGEERLSEVERCWRRQDRAKWSPELTRAHAGFERGREWGLDWASCVENFMDFEAACGYKDDGINATTQDRPVAVKGWLARARNWNKTVDLGELGALGSADTFIHMWWNWWAALQPEGRVLKADGRGPGGGGMLTVPRVCDWGSMGGLHGKNGLLQVMASLLWWGERVEGDPLDTARWSSAVDEVGYVLGEVTAAVKKRGYAKRVGTKGKSTAKGKKRKASELEEEGDEEQPDANEETSTVQPRRGRSKVTDKSARGGAAGAKRGRKRK
ncbi:hypothetical protein C8R43DRAFT_960459 [Mycena crocata]|nr:hypothetical protein C8R43DRAFT_960459 [Mycena crocata]